MSRHACANKRRKKPSEAHLGDVWGDPMPMVRRQRAREPVDGVEAIKAGLWSVSYAIIIGAILFATFMLAMISASRVRAREINEGQVREDCTRDALRFCTVDALVCLKKETPECRAAVLACMLEHRAKLQKKCSRHLF